MNPLYPLKFQPILKDKIWGGTRLKRILRKEGASETAGESWEISGYNGDISVVSNGALQGANLLDLVKSYKAGLVGNSVYNKFGDTFPLLIKFIDANDILSLQVHPGDEFALKQHGQTGKTEMWYIIDSEKDASLVAGFSKKTDKNECMRFLAEGRITELLKHEKVSPGDVFLISAGIVHAIYPGILLAEIQQTSDLTYRLYDWGRNDNEGRARELHTELALGATDFNFEGETRISYSPRENENVSLVDNRYFVTGLLTFSIKADKDYGSTDSFIIYLCTDGKFTVRYHGHEIIMTKGETLLIPSSLKKISLVPEIKSTILEVCIKL